jgi:hypothetical protein
MGGATNPNQPSLASRAANYIRQHDYHPNLDQSQTASEEAASRQEQRATATTDDLQKAMKFKQDQEKYRREHEASEYQKFNQAAQQSEQRVE